MITRASMIERSVKDECDVIPQTILKLISINQFLQ
jgi:hypothetical protein